jgi:hypothetical protein
MESPKVMTLHGIIIGIIAYFIMIYGLKQSSSTAEYRSVLLGMASVLYMMHFGHELPKLPK